MNTLYFLLRHDFKLLYRYKIITISVIVTLLYILTFYGLSQIIDTEKLIVLVIFNDPALLGFLFAGIMVLFEKNENTLQALSVTPVQIKFYILSRAISLTLIALFCCYGMVFAAKKTDFHFFHFTMASILSSLIFTFLGFVVVAKQNNFNNYIIRAILIILFLCFPFISYFDLCSNWYFILFPTHPLLELYSLSFIQTDDLVLPLIYYSSALIWLVISYLWALKAMSKNFGRL